MDMPTMAMRGVTNTAETGHPSTLPARVHLQPEREAAVIDTVMKGYQCDVLGHPQRWHLTGDGRTTTHAQSLPICGRRLQCQQ